MNLAAFGLAQFPLGVMLDRYGGRNTLVAMLLLACAGTLLFAAAESYAALLAARALIGAGFAGALLSSFKSFTHWLPKRRLPLAFSIQSFVGGVGFMAATHPVTLALEYFTWRQIMFASGGAVALSIAMLLFCAPREDCGTEGRVETLLSSACGMLRFAWDKRLWYVAPVVTATEAVLYSFAYLWIGPWMRDAAALGERSAGLMMLLSSAGIAAGYLLNGVTADFCSRWKWMTWERLYACTGVLFSALMGGARAFRRKGRAALVSRYVPFHDVDDLVSDNRTPIRRGGDRARLLSAQFHNLRGVVPDAVARRRHTEFLSSRGRPFFAGRIQGGAPRRLRGERRRGAAPLRISSQNRKAEEILEIRRFIDERRRFREGGGVCVFS